MYMRKSLRQTETVVRRLPDDHTGKFYLESELDNKFSSHTRVICRTDLATHL